MAPVDAPVAEWVDATDLKSVGRKALQVRVLPGAPATGVPEHVRVRGEGQTCVLAAPCNQPIDVARGHRPATFGRKSMQTDLR